MTAIGFRADVTLAHLTDTSRANLPERGIEKYVHSYIILLYGYTIIFEIHEWLY